MAARSGSQEEYPVPAESDVRSPSLWRFGPGLVGALVLIGVVTGLGVTTAVGCVTNLPWVLSSGLISYEPPWQEAPLNVILSAVFLAFACTAVASTRRIAAWLMAVEFVGFVAFLFLLRGGYAVGYAGVPISQVAEFDILSAAAQAGVLGLLVFGKHPNRRLLIRVGLLGICVALLIVATKAAFFSVPARW